MKALSPANPDNTAQTQPEPSKSSVANGEPATVAWQEFLEEDADCCGGCHHKPR